MTGGGTPGRLLVTGATGFIGTHVVRAALAEGRPVRALARGGAALPPGVERADAADLDDRLRVRRALDGVETVIHLAGRAHVLRDRSPDPLAEFRRVNVEGTRTLLEQAIDAGVSCFVFVSSISALTSASEATVTDATTPSPDTPYGVSKLEAERAVRALAAAAGIRAPILRPPLVYGPGMRGNPLRLFRLVDRGLPVPVGGGEARRSPVYVANLVAALHAAERAPGAATGTFVVSDAPPVSTAEFVREIACALGRTPRIVHVPPALLRAAGRVGDVLARATPWPLTSDTVERLLGSLPLDGSGLARSTGFVPPFSRAAGLAATAAWYRASVGAPRTGAERAP